VRILLAAIALIVVGCGATTTPSGPLAAVVQPSPSDGPLASVLPSSASPLPSPSPHPDAVRKAAATTYAAAAAKYNNDTKALAKKCKTYPTLKVAKSCYARAAKIEGAFVSAIKGIPVPADTAGDLHSLVAKVTAVDCGAEEEWSKRTGRPMTAEELERVLRRYPGDV
jgi:hypothetical protein